MNNYVPKILVVGGASRDVIEINGVKHRSAGGAGLYTALAAARCGADVTLFSPCPDPMPHDLLAISSLVEWTGPTVTADELPAFHIKHETDRTIYVQASFGAESLLDPSSLPVDLSQYDLIHLVPLGDTAKQLAFIRVCRERGAGLISASTGIPLLNNNTGLINDVMRESDLFFLNEEEARCLFAGADQIEAGCGKQLYVTRGVDGISVCLGDHEVSIESVEADVLDPTGAGDTFCGATIAGLANGMHPVNAARQGAALAAEMITGIGPATLQTLSGYPFIKSDDRVVANQRQIERIAKLIAGLESEQPFDFVAPSLPAIDRPLTVAYFFVTTLQQFGFWSTRDDLYHLPLVARIGDEKLKGAFYLFMAYRKKLHADPEYFSPERQASQSLDEMLDLFRCDNGNDVMPAVKLHLAAAQRYGRTMLELGWHPEDVLEIASRSERPLKSFLSLLDHVGGYREDPLRKKSTLLAMILNSRPENYFAFGDSESLPPIIDYHCMRACLRMGLIDVVDEALSSKLCHRSVLGAADEESVRSAAYAAVEQLARLSGRSMATVDRYFFFSRERCPEMTTPECARCSAETVCEQRKEMFQPVFRTDFY